MLCSTLDAARVLGVSRSTIIKMVKRNPQYTVRVGNLYKIKIERLATEVGIDLSERLKETGVQPK